MYLRKLKKHQNNISLQDYTATDKDGNQVSLEEKIPDNSISTEDLVAYRSDLKEVMGRIKHNLTSREQEIIKLRYGIGCKPRTQQQIADIYGISRSYVSRIEKAAINKLKK